MKAPSSRVLFRLSVYVTSAAILSILINLFANVFSNKSLNSTGYYIIVIALSAASIVFGILQVWPKFSAFNRTNDEQQTYGNSSDTFGNKISWESNDVKTQQQDYPVKVTMEINGTPVTIESPDVAKIEDILKHITQSTQASNLAEAKAQLRVRENTETYKTESNPE
jgi:hypothetical protein